MFGLGEGARGQNKVGAFVPKEEDIGGPCKSFLFQTIIQNISSNAIIVVIK